MSAKSIAATQSHPRRPWVVAGGAAVALLVAGALYLNYTSARWIPEADAKVKAAREQQTLADLAELERRAADEPRSAAAQLGFARALVEHGSFVAALMPAERAVQADGESADARLLLAKICTTLGYRKDALTHYRAAMRLAPQELETYQRTGDLLLALGRREEAERVFRLAREQAPNLPGPRLSLAQLHLSSERAGEALQELEPTLAAPDPPVAVLYLAGKACQSLGKTKRGVELLRRATTERPDFAEAFHTLGSIHSNESNYAAGIPALQRAVALDPNNAAYHYALANALRLDRSRPGHLKEALREYEQALEINPEDPFAHYYYGVALQDLGETRAAIREYLRTLEVQPDFVSVYHRLGSAYAVLGDPQRSRRAYATFARESRKAIAEVHGKRRENSIVDTAESHYQRGLRLLEKGERRAAEGDFRVALQRDPSHGLARRKLRELEASR